MFDYSFSSALYDGLLGGFLHGTQLISSLWCLHYLFLGSLLSYSILLICEKIKNHPLIPDVPVHGLIIDIVTGELKVLVDGY